MKEKKIQEKDPGILQTQLRKTQRDRPRFPPLKLDCCLNIQTSSLGQMLHLEYYLEPKIYIKSSYIFYQASNVLSSKVPLFL